MVIATAFAWFAWLIVIIILSDVPMGEALWHWFVFWPMTITGWVIGASDWSNRTGIKLWGRKAGDSHGSARFATRKERAAFEGGDRKPQARRCALDLVQRHGARPDDPG